MGVFIVSPLKIFVSILNSENSKTRKRTYSKFILPHIVNVPLKVKHSEEKRTVKLKNLLVSRVPRRKAREGLRMCWREWMSYVGGLGPGASRYVRSDEQWKKRDDRSPKPKELPSFSWGLPSAENFSKFLKSWVVNFMQLTSLRCGGCCSICGRGGYQSNCSSRSIGVYG